MRHIKPPSVNVSTWVPNIVKLHDGTEVTSDSEEWRAECEARWVIKLPDKGARRRFIWGEPNDKGVMSGGVAGRRGKQSAQKLEDKVRELWYSRDTSR